MHQAPAVHWEVSRTRFQVILLVILSLGVAGVHAAWWMHSDAPPLALFLGSTAAMVAGVLAYREGAAVRSGCLKWDGHAWTWSGLTGVALPGRPAVIIDLQCIMLVCWDSHGGGRRWFWLALADDRARWRALRRALYSSRLEGPGASQPPAHLAGSR